MKTSAKEPPEILEPLKPYAIREGETIVLSTQIVGNPLPTISWFKDDKPLKEVKPAKDEITHTFTLLQPTLKDAGEYSVLAVNEMGKAVTRASVVVEGTQSKIFDTLTISFCIVIRTYKY